MFWDHFRQKLSLPYPKTLEISRLFARPSLVVYVYVNRGRLACLTFCCVISIVFQICNSEIFWKSKKIAFIVRCSLLIFLNNCLFNECDLISLSIDGLFFISRVDNKEYEYQNHHQQPYNCKSSHDKKLIFSMNCQPLDLLTYFSYHLFNFPHDWLHLSFLFIEEIISRG